VSENIAETLKDLIIDIKEIKPRGKNPRRGDVETIKESLEVNGQYRPIVVNKKTGEVLAGNHTLKAAKSLGWKKIAATYVEVDEEEAARIVLVDNRANDVATYENTVLVELLKEFEDLKGTGYTNADITSILQELGADAAKEGETDPDDVPEPPEEPTTKPGYIWQLGSHRLICGDSTDDKVVEKLMDGRKADLLLTDPPYGVSYSEKANELDGGNRKAIANDGLVGKELNNFLLSAFAVASQNQDGGAPYYCFHPDLTRMEFEASLRSCGLKPRQCLIWVKGQFVIGQQDYQSQHEPILYGWKEGAAHKWYGAFDKSTVIEHDRPHKSELHPTTKPVGLLEKLIKNSSQYGDAVLDIFAGSGSTLIACERLGRHGYMVELDPAYCDVIVKRWEDHTGQVAELLTT